MVAMVTKTLKRMETSLGFIQIPAKNRTELLGNMTIPFVTKLNGLPAKVDKYGRIWSGYLKNRYEANAEVSLRRNEGEFQVIANGQKQEIVISDKATVESVINGKRILYNT